jgi:hypothetical protein
MSAGGLIIAAIVLVAIGFVIAAAILNAAEQIADDVLDAFTDWSGDTHLVDVMGMAAPGMISTERGVAGEGPGAAVTRTKTGNVRTHSEGGL